MSIAQLIAAAQTSGSQSGDSNLPIAEYLMLAIVAPVLALVATMFIRTRKGRSSK